MRRPMLAAVSTVPRKTVTALVVTILVITSLAVLAPSGRVDARESVATLWGESAPSGVRLDPDTRAVTLGTPFTAAENAYATDVRFYKVDGVTGTHTGALWTKSGRLLTTVTFADETSSGWQTAKIDTPVPLQKGQDYVVAYQVPAGGKYATTVGARSVASKTTKLVASGPGVYAYGSRMALPRSTWRASQYWVDVVVTPRDSDSRDWPWWWPWKDRGNGPDRPTPTPTPKPTSTSTPVPTPTPTPTESPVVTDPPVDPAPSTPPTTPTTPPTTAPPTTPPAPPATGTFPTAQTAGIPAGWSPAQTRSGDLTISQAGAVVEDLRISNGTIYVQAPNVTLRRIEGTNVRVFNTAGSGCVGRGLVVEDSTFRGSRSNNGDAVIGDGGFTVRNTFIDGVPEGIRVGYANECGGVTVERTFVRITPPSPCGDWHGDGIQGYGGGHLVVRNSTIFMEESNTCSGTAPFFYPAGQGNTSVDIDGLLLSGGGYPFRLGTSGKVTGLSIVDRSWSYGTHEVQCSALSAWQAQVVRLDGNGQPVTVRSVACR